MAALPCIGRLSPQYEWQLKLSCLTETTRKLAVSSQLPEVRTMRKLTWPLLKVNRRILGFYLDEEQQILFKKKTAIILPGYTRRTTSELPYQTKATLWRQLES